MRKPRILLLYTGGTISQVKDEELNVLVPSKKATGLTSLIPEVHKYFDIESVSIENLDSSNIQPRHWEKLARVIYNNYKDFDGFVVTHGTDTMSYTASAVSYALTNLGKPVVFTGSQLPVTEIGTDAKTNLIHAFQVAAMDIAEVVVVFGNRILRGNRSSKQSESAFDAFWSPVFSDLGKIRMEIELFDHHKKRDKRIKPILNAHFQEEILTLTVTPGMKPLYLNMLIESGIKGIVLQGFGAGNLPILENSLIESVHMGMQKNIPIVITSQCAAGVANVFIYETGIMAEKTGAISAKDMTVEAAITKLMWVLSQTTDLKKIKQLMQKDIAGEIAT